MTEYLEFVLRLLIPAYILAGLFFLWSRNSRTPGLVPILRKSAIGWALLVTLTFHFAVFSAVACDGNWIFGFSNCTVIPATLADISFVLVVFSFGGGVLYAAALLAIGGIIKIVGARRRSSNAPDSRP